MTPRTLISSHSSELYELHFAFTFICFNSLKCSKQLFAGIEKLLANLKTDFGGPVMNSSDVTILSK